MKVEASIKYLATKIGQLEYEKAILLGQLEELNKTVEQLKKEVETIGSNPKGIRANETKGA